jgi:hypothetical protein
MIDELRQFHSLPDDPFAEEPWAATTIKRTINIHCFAAYQYL